MFLRSCPYLRMRKSKLLCPRDIRPKGPISLLLAGMPVAVAVAAHGASNVPGPRGETGARFERVKGSPRLQPKPAPAPQHTRANPQSTIPLCVGRCQAARRSIGPEALLPTSQTRRYIPGVRGCRGTGDGCVDLTWSTAACSVLTPPPQRKHFLANRIRPISFEEAPRPVNPAHGSLGAQRLGNIRSSAIYQGNLHNEWIAPGRNLL